MDKGGNIVTLAATRMVTLRLGTSPSGNVLACMVTKTGNHSIILRSRRLVGTLNRRTDVTGRASVTWAPSGIGLDHWRAIAGSTLDYSTGSSPWVRWSIGR